MTNIRITNEEVYQFLTPIHLAVFGTTMPDGSPYLTTMYYVVDKELNFYFITKSETAKAKNIAQNPHVSVVVSDKHNYKTINARGVAVQLNGVEKIKAVIHMFSEVYRNEGVIEEGKLFNWPPPLEKIETGEITVYELKPTHMTYADYKDASPLSSGDSQEIISS